MTRVAIRFGYDGTAFDSFARQPGRRTVEGELLHSLRDAEVIRDNASARYGVASRTDRDVSAWGNVCALNVDVDPRAVVHGVETPPGLWLVSAVEVSDDFSPRAAASERVYRYHVSSPAELDWGAVKEAARMFVGLHDYRNFCRKEAGASTRRRIRRIITHRRGARGYVQFVAPNFLWEQVRRIMHALLAVGNGDRATASVAAQLRGAGKPERPAPAEPLVLEHVELPVVFPKPSKNLVSRVDESRRRAIAAADFYSGFASSLPIARR